MIYFQERYIRTKSNRVLKLDGWNPIAEFHDGVWLKSKNVSSEEILDSQELTSSELAKYNIASSVNLDTDNVGSATAFSEAVICSAALKFHCIEIFIKSLKDNDSNDSAGLIDYKALRTDEETKELMWLECVCSSYIFYRSINVFAEDLQNFDKTIGEPFLGYGIYAWLKVLFPKTKIEIFDVQSRVNSFCGEYDKAAMDPNRIERTFSKINDYTNSAKDFHWTQKVSFCFLQRIHNWIDNYPEDLISHNEKAPLFLSKSGIMFDSVFMDWAFEVYLDIVPKGDGEAMKILANLIRKNQA